VPLVADEAFAAEVGYADQLLPLGLVAYTLVRTTTRFLLPILNPHYPFGEMWQKGGRSSKMIVGYVGFTQLATDSLSDENEVK
jgi:hypothetical protein